MTQQTDLQLAALLRGGGKPNQIDHLELADHNNNNRSLVPDSPSHRRAELFWPGLEPAPVATSDNGEDTKNDSRPGHFHLTPVQSPCPGGDTDCTYRRTESLRPVLSTSQNGIGGGRQNLLFSSGLRQQKGSRETLDMLALLLSSGSSTRANLLNNIPHRHHPNTGPQPFSRQPASHEASGIRSEMNLAGNTLDDRSRSDVLASASSVPRWGPSGVSPADDPFNSPVKNEEDMVGGPSPAPQNKIIQVNLENSATM